MGRINVDDVDHHSANGSGCSDKCDVWFAAHDSPNALSLKTAMP
jgi:hypothetical protein